MEIAIIGVASYFNLMVLLLKFNQGRYNDLALDVATLVILSYVFGGTITGLQIAMIASALMSVTLYIFPPKFLMFEDDKKQKKSRSKKKHRKHTKSKVRFA